MSITTTRLRRTLSGGPPESVRRNRVVVMLTDGEFATLRRWADERELPFGTVAYEAVARALRRRGKGAKP